MFFADVRGINGRNPLHGAAHSGNFEMVRTLIEYDRAYIKARDSGGSTPLLSGLGGRNFKDSSVLRLLPENGADINVSNQIGRTPLIKASFHGALETVRLLLEHGADVDVKNINGKTALQFATDRGHGEVVELLREHGAK